jgi:P27 family predicted phage terminase small subunit
MARARVPMEKRELEGTVRAKHRKKAEGTPDVVVLKTLVECPDLSKRAKKYWPFIRKCLNALPVTAEADITTVQRLVETYAEVRYCMEVIEDEGWFYESETKTGLIKRAHPAVSQMNEADRRLRAYLQDFGLTPASRTKVKGEGNGDHPQDPLQAFLQ